MERAVLRHGNHPSVKLRRRVLLPVIRRYPHLSIPKFFHSNAACANPKLPRLLEKEGHHYTIGIKPNAVWGREIEQLLSRPVERSSG